MRGDALRHQLGDVGGYRERHRNRVEPIVGHPTIADLDRIRRDALAGCMKKLRARDLELLETCYGRAVCIQEVALAWGRSTQSIHNSLRRLRRLLFECVRRSLAQEGLA